MVSQQLIIHARKEAVALSHLSTKQSHPLDGAGILQIAGIDITPAGQELCGALVNLINAVQRLKLSQV